MRKTLIIIILMSVFSYSCDRKKLKVDYPSPGMADYGQDKELLADSIIYDVTIKTSDPDDEWSKVCLSRLDREKLTRKVFDAVYSGNAIPYDYASGSQLSISDVKAIEEKAEFSREKVATIQFTEKWSFDEEKMTFEKKVYSIMIGYELFSDSGEFRGYRAAFRIDMKK